MEIQIRLTEQQVKAINELIKRGIYNSLSEYIRAIVTVDLYRKKLI